MIRSSTQLITRKINVKNPKEIWSLHTYKKGHYLKRKLENNYERGDEMEPWALEGI